MKYYRCFKCLDVASHYVLDLIDEGFDVELERIEYNSRMGFKYQVTFK